MPCDYKQYPSNWKSEIRPAIMARAKNRCEWCNVHNYGVGVRRDGAFEYVAGNLYMDDLQYTVSYQRAKEVYDMEIEFWKEHGKPDGEPKPTLIILTIAHIHNPDKMDCRPENLAALCQKCHLGHDIRHHMQNARDTRNKRKGLQELF